MTLTAQEASGFNQSRLLDTFNQSVLKRMAEEHVFLKVLDEIFQAQGQEIARYADEVHTLQMLLTAANQKIVELQKEQCKHMGLETPPSGDTVIKQERFDSDANEYARHVEQAASNGVDDERAARDGENGSGGSGGGSGGEPSCEEDDNDDDDDDYEAIIPDITIKEESDDDSGTNPFSISDYGAVDSDAIDTEDNGSYMAGEEFPGTSKPQINEGAEAMKPKRKRKRSGGYMRSTFECPFCNSTFSMWSAMKRRVVLENGEKVYTCKECKEKHNLVRASHAYKKPIDLERPYECKTCNKRFTQSSSLACHVRSHTGDRPFPCRVCGRAFARSDYLKAHMKIQ